MTARLLKTGVLLLVSVPTLAWLAQDAHGAQQTALKQGRSQVKNKSQVHLPEPDGQRVFEQNCSRCHSAPEGFSTRITGTVLRHMRVRASLSAQEERALLHFMGQ